MTRLLGIAALTLSLFVSVMPSASAQSVQDEAIERIKTEAQAAINQRVATLVDLEAAINSAEHVSASHAEQLLNETRSARSGLATLDTSIQEATTLDVVLPLVANIATEYRVYLVLVPKVFEVIGSDVLAAVAIGLSDVESDLDAAIQAVEGAGFDTDGVRATFDAAVASRVLAHDLAAPVADLVIDLTAADWPDPARGQLQSGRESLIDAQHAARAAATGYQQTIVELRRLLRAG